ncbi:MAG: DUF2284 domain-containing protein [Oscillospiraceae bacterium]
MLDKTLLAEYLSPLPIYQYEFIKITDLKFEPKIRHICASECPMYGKSWACPPGVGTFEACRARCLKYEEALLIATVSEVGDISNMSETLSTRREHEGLTRRVRNIVRKMCSDTFVLSSEACAFCSACTYPDAPCRHPERMFPCIESHCILVTELAERFGIEFIRSANIVTWFSLIFFS